MRYIVTVNFKNGANKDLVFDNFQDVYGYVHKYADSLNKVIDIYEVDTKDLEFRRTTNAINYINNQILNNHQ